MDIRKVKKLIELLDESGIAEIEITEGEESVRISRYGPGAPPAPAPIAVAAPAPLAAVVPAATEASAPAQVAEPEEEGFLVAAPMVGTFYGSSSPGAAPYVQVGDRVNEGDTLCIIEAMKMMNQIDADVSGVVKSIRVQNGEPVEYGQTLIIIDQRQAD
ncbi:MAG: acetyl-CoA carboxylase biotin carboxyl carrier protein [Gammaproteobacteria bacterium]|jgi:acetyl-CoA carboxylase biotin carboxyl carrier protein|nr:acetyl-CoA carboxylase biotin carboxyl carrier protein [Gammaproteobacteria bacterium]MDH3750244.1 acetyl-CoA carboxylase biotin carboxyl carrier protein [Gammaproteobacteria bacterium]MDH3805287.1 acetyl-CoA carboxylase biotin carboxyl carrier protein [Gammaproteobacteria bacterium]